MKGHFAILPRNAERMWRRHRGGAEYAFKPSRLARAECGYYHLDNYQNPAPANGVAPYEVANEVQSVTVGVNCKF